MLRPGLRSDVKCIAFPAMSSWIAEVTQRLGIRKKGPARILSVLEQSTPMAGIGSSKVAFRLVSLKSVKPVIPLGTLEKEQLVDDLETMGCEGLILAPWGIKGEEMVQEFQVKRSSEWFKTI